MWDVDFENLQKKCANCSKLWEDHIDEIDTQGLPNALSCQCFMLTALQWRSPPVSVSTGVGLTIYFRLCPFQVQSLNTYFLLQCPVT